MVAMIHSIRRLYQVVRYSEKKVETGKARFLLANAYPLEPGQLTAAQKLARLEMRSSLNPRASVVGQSIALNFDASERLERVVLERLAAIYMEKMGFGEQPYLVYEHMDAPNPHLHILASPIRRDGSIIKMDLQKRQLSSDTTTELEREFDLVRAYPNERLHFRGDRALGKGDVRYDQGPRGPLVNTILAKVLTDYRFTTLEEFNALLRPYRLLADRGKPGSNIYEHRGLVYRPLDETGRPEPSYLKASKLEGKPTLAFLEQRFERDRGEQERFLPRVRVAMDWALAPSADRRLDRLQAALTAEGIEMQWGFARQAEPVGPRRTLPAGPGQEASPSAVPSLCYIDHQTHWAFGEAAMGPAYTASSVLGLCGVQAQELERFLTLGKAPALAFGHSADPSAEDNSAHWSQALTPSRFQ